MIMCPESGPFAWSKLVFEVWGEKSIDKLLKKFDGKVGVVRGSVQPYETTATLGYLTNWPIVSVNVLRSQSVVKFLLGCFVASSRA
jgi:hypothetical protein